MIFVKLEAAYAEELWSAHPDLSRVHRLLILCQYFARRYSTFAVQRVRTCFYQHYTGNGQPDWSCLDEKNLRPLALP